MLVILPGFDMSIVTEPDVRIPKSAAVEDERQIQTAHSQVNTRSLG